MLTRVGETGRKAISIYVDGQEIRALEGDTVLTAVLLAEPFLWASDVGDGPRAGFCLIGACQDCWVRFSDGSTRRACMASVEPGMRIARSQRDPDDD